MVQEAGSVGELTAVSDQQSAQEEKKRHMGPLEPQDRLMEELPPGQYLVEVAVPPEFSLSAEVLGKGLVAMGFERVVPDQSEKGVECRRVVADLGRSCVLLDTPLLRWSVRPIGIDVFGDLEYRLKPLDVVKDRAYELLFIARMKAHPTREAVTKTLEEMGFGVDVLSLLKKDTRIPGYPGASATLWYGVATWRGPTNYVNTDDLFIFEEVRAIGDQQSADQPDESERTEGKG